MPKPTTIKAVLLPRANADGRFTVFIRITKQSKPVYIATTVTVMHSFFSKNGSIDNPVWIDKKHPLAKAYNELIRQKLIELDTHKHEKKYSSKEIKEMIVRPYDRNDFIIFWQNIAEEKLISNGIHSKNKYKAECNKFAVCFPAAKWSQITYEALKRYESYLLTINNRNTTSKSLEFLKEIVTQYVKRHKINKDENPFNDFKIIQEKNVVSNAKEAVLDAHEINKLEEIALVPDTNRFYARYIFLVQIFAMGARIGEVLFIENVNIDTKRLKYAMEKKGSNKPMYKSILITPRLQKIIDLFFDPKKKYLFPYMEGCPVVNESDPKDKQRKTEAAIHNKVKAATSIVNVHLQEVCELANIAKKVTTHTARHTVGHILEQSGIDISKIQKTFGHESPEETKTYLAIGKPLLVDETALILETCLKIA
jgi:integrase